MARIVAATSDGAPIMAKKPFFQNVLNYYSCTLRLDTRPCKEVKFNCAVRLSLALNAGGFSVSDYVDKSRLHNSDKNHSHKWDKTRNDASTVPHLVAAEELYDHLKLKFPLFREVAPAKGQTARQVIDNCNGVVYFEDCFRRAPGKSKDGDHIDIWDGKKYGNEMLGIGASGRPNATEDLFSKARRVFFLPL